jgi:hypothetical protein
MAVDHYGKIVAPDLYLPTHMIGRVSFPLFAAIVGLRLALRPGVGSRYLDRLVPWAIVSQPVYVLAGRAWHEGNILFTLALGVALFRAVEGWSRRRRLRRLLQIGAALAVSPFVEFGPVGVIMVPVIAGLARANVSLGVWATGTLGLLANLRLPPSVLAPTDLTALLSAPVLALSPRLSGALPRLPTHAFYAFYPLHLLALHLLDLYG